MTKQRPQGQKAYQNEKEDEAMNSLMSENTALKRSKKATKILTSEDDVHTSLTIVELSHGFQAGFLEFHFAESLENMYPK